MKKYLYIFLLLSVFVVPAVEAQDIHYSQFSTSPLYINPAQTGNFECDLRAGVNYRQQAGSFTTPYETYSAFIDTRINPRFLKNHSWLGIGGMMHYDNSGDGGLTNIKAMFLSSYSKGFNSDNSAYGSLGVSLAYVNKSLNFDKLIFDSQWDPFELEFDPNLSNGEGFAENSIYYLDFNVGLMFSYMVNSRFRYELGGSVNHITQPKESFFGEDNKLGRKLIFHGTAEYMLTKNFMLRPQAMYAMHEGTSEAVFGSYLVYGEQGLRLTGGLFHRLGRDVIPALGLEYNTLAFLFSYDVNVSKQRRASDYKGGFELSLVKKFCQPKSSKRRPCKFLEFS